MNSIILCEGKTDAILISYYLGRTKQWEHYKKKPPIRIPINNEENETSNWYESNGNFVSIWAIGGKDNFKPAIKEIVRINKFGNRDQYFSKIVVISDRDNNTEEVKINELNEYFSCAANDVQLSNQTWTTIDTLDDLGLQIQFNVSCLVIPFDRPGALETFLLNALASIDDDNENIIIKTREFISMIDSEKYLQTDRQRLKAEFSTTLSIMYPEKVFSLIDTLLRSIPWEQYTEIQSGFRILEEI